MIYFKDLWNIQSMFDKYSPKKLLVIGTSILLFIAIGFSFIDPSTPI